jgi:hypothetical protein
MVTSFTQEAIGIFASDEAAVKESPGTEYDNGVKVQYTAPGKWWNWLWNKITGWFNASLSDKQSIVTEMSNVLSDAVITPDAADNHQLAKSVEVIAYRHARQHDEATITEGGVTRPVNKPYVSGVTIVLPDTELL